ncbi:MAG: cytochrome c oxidase subunit 3 [Anaplasma sp.]
MKKRHQHQVLPPSPWPVLLSLSALLTALGAAKVAQDGIYWLVALLLGGGCTIGVLYKWWCDISSEVKNESLFTHTMRSGMRIGMAVMILSEAMLFFAFFWSFFKAWLFPIYTLIDFSEKVSTSWPPDGIKTIDPWSIPFFNTVTLLLSGCTVTWSHHLLLENDIKSASRAILATIALGVIFSSFQFIEYIHVGFTLGELEEKTIYPSNFFMTTGFHGLHVVVGVIFLIVCWFRMRKGQISASCHVGFECAAWYWHFVDVVWLFLFIFLYIVSS